MKTSDAISNQQHKEKRQAHGSTFSKVMAGRKQPIRGLWIRGARYYARLNVENPLTGIEKSRRVPLSLRLDQVKRVHVNRFIESRLKENVSPRTINLDVIWLRVVLKRAMSDGLIQRLPTEGLRSLKTSPKPPIKSEATWNLNYVQ